MTRINRNDFNHDGVINHDDVTFYIHEVQTGAHPHIGDLLRFQKNGGELTAQDLIDFINAGGKMDGGDVARYVEQGGKLSQEDITALEKLGVSFKPKAMETIQGKLGGNLSRFPPGTTVQDLMDMLHSGAKITAEDLASLKGPDGKPLATMQDFIALMGEGVRVTGADLAAYQKAGGTVTADDLVHFMENGGHMKAPDLIALANGGTQMTTDQLTSICTVGHKVKLTKADFMAINPISTQTGKPYFANPNDPPTPDALIDMARMGINVTGADLRELKGPDGKPLVTELQLREFAACGGKVTGEDLAALKAAGVDISEDTVVKLSDNGLKLTGENLVELAKAGMKFTDAQLAHITAGAHVKLTQDQYIAINPISTETGQPRFGNPPEIKPADLVAMARAGVKVNALDLLDCKNPPPTASDVVNFAQAGGKILPTDIIALQKAGIKFSGDDMVELINAGVKFKPQDIVDLSRGGAVIYQDDLDWMLSTLKISLTNEQWHIINPIEVKSGHGMYS